MKHLYTIWFITYFCVVLSSQSNSVVARDIVTNEAMPNVEVVYGNSRLLLGKDGKLFLDSLYLINQIIVENGMVENRGSSYENISIFNVDGRLVKKFTLQAYGDFFSIYDLPLGWYLLKTENSSIRFLNHIGRFQTAVQLEDKITFAADGYQQMEIKLNDLTRSESIHLLKKDYTLPYLNYLYSRSTFNLLKSKPFSQTVSNVESVKILYNLRSDTLHYFNSKSFLVHYEFALNVLSYLKGKSYFSQTEYTINDNRTYLPAALDYYKDADKYIIDISAFTEVNCRDVENIWNAVLKTSFIPRNKLFVKKGNQFSDCTNVNYIDINQLIGQQIYQPLVLKETYGYIQKIAVSQIESIPYSKFDILLLDEVPNDIGVCAGIITNVFQTPLSHINVLANNRGSPNMGFRGAFHSPDFTKYIGKPVFMKVLLDTFVIREVSDREVLDYWESNRTIVKKVLAVDTTTIGLIDLKLKGHNDVKMIGGKCANFAELLKVKLEDNSSIPLPEYAIGIPFYYYIQHIRQHGIDNKIKELLSNKLLTDDPKLRYMHLDRIRQNIQNSKMSTALFNLVKDHMIKHDKSINFRFRSSTNAEDIEGFNGAGLYDSYSANLKNTDIEVAIKNVWASLWNDRAFDEREFFGIDHSSVAMGILVHRSFTSELANGVVVTHNPFNPINSAILINSQPEEISVAKPNTKVIPEQVLYYDFKIKEEAYEYLAYSNHPEYLNKKILSPEQLKTIQLFSLAIKNHYCKFNTSCKVMDIEFKLDRRDGKERIYIKQARYY